MHKTFPQHKHTHKIKTFQDKNILLPELWGPKLKKMMVVYMLDSKIKVVSSKIQQEGSIPMVNIPQQGKIFKYQYSNISQELARSSNQTTASILGHNFYSNHTTVGTL